MRPVKNILALIVTVIVGVIAGCWLATADAIETELEKRRTRGHQVHQLK